MVISTAGSMKEARSIAKTMVEKRLAACVNVLPGVVSHFMWEGKMNRAKEVMMFMKTSGRQVPKLCREIRRIHSYSVPEILYFRINGGDREYLQWVHQSTLQIQGPKGKKLLT